MADDHGILTTDEAAEMLRMSTEAVRRHARDLRGFKLKGCRRWLFRRQDLEELLGKDRRR